MSSMEEVVLAFVLFPPVLQITPAGTVRQVKGVVNPAPVEVFRVCCVHASMAGLSVSAAAVFVMWPAADIFVSMLVSHGDLTAWLAAVFRCFLVLRKGEVEEWLSWGLLLGVFGVLGVFEGGILEGLSTASEVVAGVSRVTSFGSVVLLVLLHSRGLLESSSLSVPVSMATESTLSLECIFLLSTCFVLLLLLMDCKPENRPAPVVGTLLWLCCSFSPSSLSWLPDLVSKCCLLFSLWDSCESLSLGPLFLLFPLNREAIKLVSGKGFSWDLGGRELGTKMLGSVSGREWFVAMVEEEGAGPPLWLPMTDTSVGFFKPGKTVRLGTSESGCESSTMDSRECSPRRAGGFLCWKCGFEGETKSSSNFCVLVSGCFFSSLLLTSVGGKRSSSMSPEKSNRASSVPPFLALVPPVVGGLGDFFLSKTVSSTLAGWLVVSSFVPLAASDCWVSSVSGAYTVTSAWEGSWVKGRGVVEVW